MNERRFFESPLSQVDPEVSDAVGKEFKRQSNEIELIASENIVSQAVLDAAGSVLTNKYAEGYPGKRYYGGCQYVDIVETLAIERVKSLFGAAFANVQPHSGSQANQAVFLALAKPGDTILGLSLDSGGHLTHGARPNLSGKWFHAVSYGVDPITLEIDYDEVSKLANEHKPKILIAGGSAYPRSLDFQRFREIADACGAYLMVDMAHIAGLVAAKKHASPMAHAHVVTSTTHKTLRGPRGGLILTNDFDLNKKLNSAIFPGLQGGPLMHVIAAKAVAFKEALEPEFADYIARVVENADALATTLMEHGFEIVTKGTDTHLALVDLRSKGLKGNEAEDALGRAYITCNKNGIPFDDEKPTITSGIRVGSPAATSRGFTKDDFVLVGTLIARILDGLVDNGPEGNGAVEEAVRKEVLALCAKYPLYNHSA